MSIYLISEVLTQKLDYCWFQTVVHSDQINNYIYNMALIYLTMTNDTIAISIKSTTVAIQFVLYFSFVLNSDITNCMYLL